MIKKVPKLTLLQGGKREPARFRISTIIMLILIVSILFFSLYRGFE